MEKTGKIKGKKVRFWDGKKEETKEKKKKKGMEKENDDRPETKGKQ